MKRWLIAAPLVAVLLGGCYQSDNDRLDKVNVEGTTCVVVRNGAGRVKYIDCDWTER